MYLNEIVRKFTMLFVEINSDRAEVPVLFAQAQKRAQPGPRSSFLQHSAFDFLPGDVFA
jgi:hypothetical protein